jgi:hypothetical protein
VGLAGLGANSLDSGPVVAFFKGRPGVPHPGLVWSTLDSHKIVRQATTAAPASDEPAPATALWSAPRSEQVLCLSPECAQLQVADGNYSPARVEGWGYAALATPGSVCVSGGTSVPTVALSVAWAAARLDNCVAPTGAPAPGSGYVTMADNGHILAPSTAGSVPGTLPLYAYNRTYSGAHWDYAAVASAEGVAWAEGAGYTRGALLGYVHAAQPAPCSGGGGGGGSGGTYTLGLTADVPAIPAGWEYSTIFSLAEGGPTAAVYQWGEVMRGYYGTTRLPSVTLTDIGYFSDDGVRAARPSLCCRPGCHSHTQPRAPSHTTSRNLSYRPTTTFGRQCVTLNSLLSPINPPILTYSCHPLLLTSIFPVQHPCKAIQRRGWSGSGKGGPLCKGHPSGLHAA